MLASVFFLASSMRAQERPWSVSPCELLKKPGMYGDTMVSVPGLVLYGPDQFTTHGFDCADDHGVLQLEFGGNPTDPKDQFRLPAARLEAGTVPLKKDADYETMQRLMKSIDGSGKVQMLRATLIGRFFAGPAVGAKSGEITHPSARLVISEVELVSNKPEDAVDFTPTPRTLPPAPKGCITTAVAVPSRDDADKLQRLSREPSENLELSRRCPTSSSPHHCCAGEDEPRRSSSQTAHHEGGSGGARLHLDFRRWTTFLCRNGEPTVLAAAEYLFGGRGHLGTESPARNRLQTTTKQVSLRPIASNPA